MKFSLALFWRAVFILLSLGLVAGSAGQAHSAASESISGASAPEQALTRLALQHLTLQPQDVLQVVPTALPVATTQWSEAQWQQVTWTWPTVSTNSQWPGNRLIVQARFPMASGKFQQLGVPVLLSLKRPVWVAAQPVLPGQVLTPANTRLELKDISMLGNNSVSEAPDALSRYQSRTALRVGQVLDRRLLSLTPDIRREQPVTIVLSTVQGLDISLAGTALENGTVGNWIRVKSALATVQRVPKIYRAQVINDKTVRVSL